MKTLNVTNDGDALTPGSFAKALADALAGDVIEISPLADGTPYSVKTINKAPEAPITLRPSGSSKVLIGGIVFVGETKNLIFEDFKVVQTTWPQTALVRFGNGTFGTITFLRPHFKGGYGGPSSSCAPWMNDIDPTLEYPEYVGVNALMTSGSVTELTVNYPGRYVGSLYADREYDLKLNEAFDPNSTAPKEEFKGRMIVSGGQIVSCLILEPGSGYKMNVHPAARISWTEQKAMASMLPDGFLRQGDAKFTSDTQLIVRDGLFEDLSSGVKINPAPGSILVENNTFDRIYSDFVGVNSTVAPSGVTVTWNRMSRPFSKGTDARNPHSDAIQLSQVNEAPTSWPNIQIYGNIAVAGRSRGGLQGVWISDTKAGASFGTDASLSRVTGNLLITDGASAGIAVSRPKNMLIARNTTVCWTLDNQSPRTLSVTNATHTAVARNIAEAFGTLSGVDVSLDPNLLLNTSNRPAEYQRVFRDPLNGGAGTVADALARYATEPAFESYGALVGDGYIDFTTRTLDLSKEPTVWRYPIRTGQALSETLYSGWVRVIGGTNMLVIRPTPGLEWQSASDGTGANATAWSSSEGVISQGSYVQVRATTSAAYHTALEFALSIGASTRSWLLKTIPDSTASYDTNFVAENGTSLSNFDTTWTKAYAPGTSPNDLQIINAQVHDLASNTGPIAYLRPANRIHPRADLLGEGAMYVLARASTSTSGVTGYALRVVSGNVSVRRLISGTNNAVSGPTVSAGDRTGLEMRISGGPNDSSVTIEVYKGPTPLGTWTDNSPARITEGGSTGMYYSGGTSGALALFANFGDKPI